MDNEQGTTEEQGSQDTPQEPLYEVIQRAVEGAHDMGLQMILVAMTPKMLTRIKSTNPEIYYVSKDKLKRVAKMWDKCLTNLENGLEKLD